MGEAEPVRLKMVVPHRYGLGENQRKNIAAFLGLLARMGALPASIEPERLFVPSTRDL
jgi:hypothetical protein